MEEMVEHDYEVGCAVAEQLIPKAVLWYTGEAGDHMDDEDDEDEDDGDVCELPLPWYSISTQESIQPPPPRQVFA